MHKMFKESFLLYRQEIAWIRAQRLREPKTQAHCFIVVQPQVSI